MYEAVEIFEEESGNLTSGREQSCMIRFCYAWEWVKCCMYIFSIDGILWTF